MAGVNKKEYTGSLELNWINKDKSLYYEYDGNGEPQKPIWVSRNDIRVSEPRILKLCGEYGDTSNLKDPLDNLLIKGDNLLALNTLVEMFKTRKEKDKIKFIYIDPPYNIGTAFKHYDDNLERSEWLSMMYDRLKLLKAIMRQDGIICVQLNDSQSHYMKILMDETFGSENYFASIYIQTVYPDKTLKQDRAFHNQIEQILVYRRSDLANVNQEYESYSYDKFNWYIRETSKPLKSITLGNKRVDVFEKNSYKIEQREASKEGLKDIWASGTILDMNSSGRFFRDYLIGRCDEDGYGVLYKVYDIGDDIYDFRYFTGPKRVSATKGKYYQGVPLAKLDDTIEHTKIISIENFWDMSADFGNCRNEGGVELKSGKKPEKLLMKLVNYFSNENDVVLDSFSGSGTTCAVAHKMKRRWIGVELGIQAETHCVKRLNRVVNGEYRSSADDIVNWNGGGGFRYYTLGESLINNGDINWAHSYKDISDALRIHLSYDNLAKVNDETHVCANESNYAFCIVSKELKVYNMENIYELMYDYFEGDNDFFTSSNITIYTNNGVAIKNEDLPSNILIKKIPEYILTKYNL
jgi:adenine-specific DNA-methyltransferase